MSVPVARFAVPQLAVSRFAVPRLAVIGLAGAGVLTVALAFSEWSPLARTAAPDHGIATPPRSGAVTVAGHGATLTLPGGARVHVRLAPLHADVEQQTFDARALATRFGLAEGAPYRLELVLAADARPVRVRAAELAIRDETGVALTPILAAAARAGGAARGGLPADPLRALLAPADVEIGSERVVGVCLWGRAPAGRVVVTGLAAGPLELAPQTWEADGLSDVLARVPVTERETETRAGAGTRAEDR